MPGESRSRRRAIVKLKFGPPRVMADARARGSEVPRGWKPFADLKRLRAATPARVRVYVASPFRAQRLAQSVGGTVQACPCALSSFDWKPRLSRVETIAAQDKDAAPDIKFCRNGKLGNERHNAALYAPSQCHRDIAPH